MPPADRRDLRVVPADRRTPTVAMVDDPRIDRRGRGIEGQDVLGEPAEHLHPALPQCGPPFAFGKPLDAVEDLSHGDCRNPQLVTTMRKHPLPYRGRARWRC